MALNSNKERLHFWNDLNQTFTISQIESAINTLPVDMQQVIRMHYQQMRALPEISATINKSLSSVRVYQRTGMFKLYLYFKRLQSQSR